MKIKIIKIRLGGACNQNCSFCHSNKSDNYIFNPKLIPFIKYNHFNKINYGGGEPLMYWKYMKFFIDTFPYLRHHAVTNGSLFNKEMLDYTQKYNFRIGLSLNEFTNIDQNVIKILSKVPEIGYGIVYTGDKTLDELDYMMDCMNDKLHKRIYGTYHMMHTNCNNGKVYTQQQKDEYIFGMTKRIRQCIEDTLNGKFSRYSVVTSIAIQDTNKKLPGCCHDYFVPVSLDGRIMECPYDGSYMCSIEEELSYPKYNKDTCYSCNLKGKCRVCYKSINNDECYMLNGVNNGLEQALKDYNINRTTLFNLFKERRALNDQSTV